MPNYFRPTQTLQDIANTHARCRTLSQPTRDYFAAVAKGTAVADGFTSDDCDHAFWEALGSCATRAGQSMERRRMVDALNRLKREVYSGDGDIPTPRTYTVGLPVTVTVHPDCRVDIETDLSDLSEEIARDDESDYDHATAKADAETIANYLREQGLTR